MKTRMKIELIALAALWMALSFGVLNTTTIAATGNPYAGIEIEELVQTRSTFNPGGVAALVVSGTANPTGVVSITCAGATCPGGMYEVSTYIVVRTANTAETEPNIAGTLGWTDAFGAQTGTGFTTLSSATTGGKVSSITPVVTTGALTMTFALSGTSGAQTFDIHMAAKRIK